MSILHLIYNLKLLFKKLFGYKNMITLYTQQPVRFTFTIKDELGNTISLEAQEGRSADIVIRRKGSSTKYTYVMSALNDGSDGIMIYDLNGTVLNEDGVWEAQCILKTNGLGNQPSNILEFKVKNKL